MSVSGQMEGGHVGHGAWEGAGGGAGGYIERILKGVGVRTDGGGSCWPWGMGGGGGGGRGTLKGY